MRLGAQGEVQELVDFLDQVSAGFDRGEVLGGEAVVVVEALHCEDFATEAEDSLQNGWLLAFLFVNATL